MKRRGSARAALALVLFGLSALGVAGCCCGSNANENRSPLQQCLDGCSVTQMNCDYLCRGDNQCTRTCAESYHTCIRICAEHEKGTASR